ncbi:uncharacterized protein [Macrobrachium rosenbergii]|uniref:uncharacterized protein n=1 Tax=Macrobrachium rosenbergii TaxID=79674 RepID=UPI0034D6A7F7
MNDFKTQLNGLLATLQTLPDVEQQTALALLQSSLDGQLKIAKHENYENTLPQDNLSNNEDACHSALHSTNDPPSEIIHSESGGPQQDFLEIAKSPKLPHHEQRVKEARPEIILQLPAIGQAVSQDSGFTEKIKVSASLQHNFSEIEPSTSAFTQTTESLENPKTSWKY